jgi:hypothetical protein
MLELWPRTASVAKAEVYTDLSRVWSNPKPDIDPVMTLSAWRQIHAPRHFLITSAPALESIH